MLTNIVMDDISMDKIIVWLIIFIILTFGGIGLGISGSLQARKKGHKGLANILILLAILGPFGIVGIAGFLVRDLSEKTTIPLDSPCPKCTHDRGHFLRQGFFNKKTRGTWIPAWANALELVFFLLLGGGFSLLLNSLIPIFISIASALPVFFNNLNANRNTTKARGKVYQCASCKHHWVVFIE